MEGAVSAASDDNVTVSLSDSADNTVTQHPDAVEDNALKMGKDTQDNVLNDSGTVTVIN